MSAVSEVTGKVRVSVLVYLPQVCDPIDDRIGAIRDALSTISHEVIFIDDGAGLGDDWLHSLARTGGRMRLIRLARQFGETAAISSALPHADGEIILTLPGSLTTTSDEIRQLFAGIEDGADMMIGRRSGEPGAGFEKPPLKIYHWLVHKATGARFRDFTSGVRAFRREVTEEIALYGEMIRFLPFLAAGRGYLVEEVKLISRWKKGNGRISKPVIYLNRILDIITLYFLLRFTQKPLRFFGLLGAMLLIPGILIDLFLFVDKIALGHALAGRPLLLLGILLTVLGAQTISIGLLGEMIIFTHSRETRDYSIREVLE